MNNSDNIRCIRKYQKKDGSITYHAEVRRKNAKPLRESFRTLTAAKNWVRKVETSILDGKYVPDNKTRKHTLADLIDQYTSIHLSKHPKRLKDQTIHLNWWRDSYGSRALIEITSALLTQAREELLKATTPSGTLRTNSTVNRYLSTMSSAFTMAFKELQWISENPFKRVSKLKEGGGRNRFLTKEELHTFLECCQQNRNPHLFGMVLIAALMGLRFGEVASLKWKHVDLENGFITIETTKNGDRRAVPLPEQVACHLKSLERPKHPEDYVFPSRDPTKRHPLSMIRKAFKKALKQAGIEDFRYHDLRHTCASHLAMNGATQGELMEILGHRSPSMTRRYAHFSREHISRVLQKTSNNLMGN